MLCGMRLADFSKVRALHCLAMAFYCSSTLSSIP